MPQPDSRGNALQAPPPPYGGPGYGAPPPPYGGGAPPYGGGAPPSPPAPPVAGEGMISNEELVEMLRERAQAKVTRD